MSGRFSLDAVFRGIDMMSGVTRKISRGMDRIGRDAKLLEKRLGGITRGIATVGATATAAAAAAGAGIALLMRPALELEDAMAKLATVTTPLGTMEAALAESKAAAIDWSKKHVASADEFSAAQYNMASAGLNNAQAIAGTRSALTLATATMGDAETAGNLMATVFNVMGDKSRDAADEFNHLGDVLAKTQAVFQIKDLAQLNESLKMGMPAAKMYGVSVEQLSNALGTLNTAGLQGSMAGTAFSAAMRQMSKASKELHFQIARTADGGVDFAGTMRNIEKKFGSFAKMTDKQKGAFQKAFGDEGLRAIALMLGKTDELAANLDKVTDSTGAAAEQAKLIESRGSGPWKILKNRVNAVAIAFGGALLPAFEQLQPEIDNVIESVSKWIEQNKGLIATKFLDFVAEAVPLVRAFAAGIREGFRDLAPIVTAVAKPIIGLFGGSEGKDRVETAKNLGEAVVKLGATFVALTFATNAVTFATNAANAAVGLYNFLVGAGPALAKFFTAALYGQAAAGGAAATGMKAAAAGMAAFALAAGAAIGAMILLLDQLEDFKKQNDGLGFGDFLSEWATTDKSMFEVVDDHMNKKAKERFKAEQEAASKGMTPSTPEGQLAELNKQIAALNTSLPSTMGAEKISTNGLDVGQQMALDANYLAALQRLPMGGNVAGNSGGLDVGQQMALETGSLASLENLQVTGPAEIVLPDRLARDDKMTITVRAEPGTEAEVTEKPKTKGTTIKMQPSGAF